MIYIYTFDKSKISINKIKFESLYITKKWFFVRANALKKNEKTKNYEKLLHVVKIKQNLFLRDILFSPAKEQF